MKVFLDSCVILSRIPREVAIALAKAGEIELAYSRSVEAESMHVAKRNGIEVDIAGAFTSLRLLTEPVEAEAGADIWLPDEDDRHVLAGAIAASADVLLTENLRDFPVSALRSHEIDPLAPDALYFKLLDENSHYLDGYEKKALKRAKLYRTAKLITREC